MTETAHVREPFNRTIVELKHEEGAVSGLLMRFEFVAFNRTIVELKLYQSHHCVHSGI